MLYQTVRPFSHKKHIRMTCTSKVHVVIGATKLAVRCRDGCVSICLFHASKSSILADPPSPAPTPLPPIHSLTVILSGVSTAWLTGSAGEEVNSARVAPPFRSFMMMLRRFVSTRGFTSFTSPSLPSVVERLPASTACRPVLLPVTPHPLCCRLLTGVPKTASKNS